MKKPVLLAGLFAATAVSAQTFTVDDTLYTGLSTNYYVMDSNAVNLSAVTGTGVTWNYASLWAYETATIPDVIIDASASSNAGDFPTAAYNDDMSSGVSVFFSNNADSTTVHGFVFTADGNEVIVKHTVNPLKAMTFSMAVGNSYTDQVAGEVDIMGNIFTSTGSADITVDGFGTLNVSGNTHTNILRVKLVESIDASITVPFPVSGTVTRTVYSYYDLAADKQAIFVHATISIDSDVLNDDFTAIYYSGTPVHYLGAEENAISSTSVYPNPANDMVTIINEGNVEVLNVVNVSGQVVTTIANPKIQETLNVADFAPGIYIIQMTKNGIVTEQKLIVE